MIKLFKDGDCMAISTDAKNEQEFITEISDLFSQMIRDGQFMFYSISGEDPSQILPIDGKMTTEILNMLFENDWGFQFAYWLPQIVDICCKLRGYKNDVFEKRILIAGHTGVNGLEPIATTYQPPRHQEPKSND